MKQRFFYADAFQARFMLAELCLVGMLFLSPWAASAQDALRYSLQDETAVQTNEIDLEALDYTIKSGDFRLLITPSIEADWNDNVTLVRSNAVEDYIIRPMVQLDASYPITQQNLLQFKIGAGYDIYLQHSEFSALRLESGSEISFDTFIKDFRFNVHDRFQYVEDPAEQATIVGTGRFGGLDNLAGVSAFWDLQDVVLSLDYDHRNFISSSSTFEYLNLNSDLILTRATFALGPGLSVGPEAGASFTSYQQRVLNDNDSCDGGAFIDWKPSSYLDIQAHGGYTAFFFDQTSQTIQAFDQYGAYGELTVSHKVSEYMTLSLSAGREIRLGTESDVVKDWYVGAKADWNVVRNLKFSPNLTFQSGKQGQPNSQGTLTENFNWLVTGFALSQPITKNLSAGMSYRLTLRGSSMTSRAYNQDYVGASLTYRID